ncbi:cytosine deaminase protein-like protein [Rhizodiscina lignyota]|uniref:Cytosine deaminase protein-like protein n=1 Tax=Rhizodiscina lignyota TaxID=1504668 RepID=A0A9P4IA89_9PEZI|nr:cytosine deaminase protein-like protein [Rhizodiscina lignyota]
MGVRLPRRDPSSLWDVSIREGKIQAVEPHDYDSPDLSTIPSVLDASDRFLAPSLCHAHIHLDKCFILQDPKFSDLEIIKGDFNEAMSLTGQAKKRFEEDDLLRRGRRLIEESIQAGVTHMRAFVELDGDVMTKCLDAGLKLKKEFQDRCEIQICAFAQYAIFSGPDGGELVRDLMREAAKLDDVDVVGSTPYVEQDIVKMKMNVRWISSLALNHGKHLDFHMDYHLDETKRPFMFDALRILHERNWRHRNGKAITMGHCTRLTCFKQKEQWKELGDAIGTLPVHFVGLPTSDLFMMRTSSGVRGTLNVLEMIEWHLLNASIAINNVGNAFTPHGSCDPLSIASMCVGVYQAGTKKDAELLYDCVSSRAKSAIGLPQTSLNILPGEPANFVILGKHDDSWRTKKSIAEIVYDGGGGRMTIKDGRLTTPRGR